MRRPMNVGFVVLLLIGVLGVLQSAWSQEVTASIVGTVTDPSGAPLKDANVTATIPSAERAQHHDERFRCV